MNFSKLVFKESAIQGCQMVEFKGQIPTFFIFNKQLTFLFCKSGNIVKWAIMLNKTDKEWKKREDGNTTNVNKDGSFYKNKFKKVIY